MVKCSYCIHFGHTTERCYYRDKNYDPMRWLQRGILPPSKPCILCKTEYHASTMCPLRCKAGCGHVHLLVHCRVICVLCYKNGHNDETCPDRCDKKCVPVHRKIDCYEKCSICNKRAHVVGDCPKQCEAKCYPCHREKECRWLDAHLDTVKMMASNVMDMESYFRLMKKLKHRPLFCIGHCFIDQEKRLTFLKSLFVSKEKEFMYPYFDYDHLAKAKYYQFYKWAPPKLQKKLDVINSQLVLISNDLDGFIKLVDMAIYDTIPRVESLKNQATKFVKDNLPIIATKHVQKWSDFKTLVADGSDSPLILKTWDDYNWAYIAYYSWPKDKRYKMLEQHLDEFVVYEDDNGDEIPGYFKIESGGKFAEISKLDDYFCQKAHLLKMGVGKLVNGKIHLPPGVRIKAKNHS